MTFWRVIGTRECGSSHLYFHLLRYWCQSQKPIRHEGWLHFERSRNPKKLPMTSVTWFQIETRQIHYLVKGKFNPKISALCSAIIPSLLSVTLLFSCSTCCYHYYFLFVECWWHAPSWADVQEIMCILILKDMECVKNCQTVFPCTVFVSVAWSLCWYHSLSFKE